MQPIVNSCNDFKSVRRLGWGDFQRTCTCGSVAERIINVCDLRLGQTILETFNVTHIPMEDEPRTNIKQVDDGEVFRAEGTSILLV